MVITKGKYDSSMTVKASTPLTRVGKTFAFLASYQ